MKTILLLTLVFLGNFAFGYNSNSDSSKTENPVKKIGVEFIAVPAIYTQTE